MELSADSDLMDHFWDDLAKGCNDFYLNASEKFASDADDMKSTIK